MRSASGREAIVDSAMRLFGERGIDSTSLREVARAAGVAPSLVVHHFGGKAGLVQAVDDAAVRVFGAAYSQGIATDGTDLLRLRAGQTAAVMRQRPDVCAYIGRALVEGTPGSEALFGALVGGGREQVESLAEREALREDADLLWATLQHFFLIWAPLSFRPLLERTVLDGSLLDPGNLERWVEANVSLLRDGLYR